ncbi:ribose 5-phosphate isomerase B [Fusarium albosuccineum]|uniref:Ribose 5-phosphate isomerase B n=1 Tax=Fusarium albosuccineum TaxID=1237068 RepID=A0A8H4L2H3_9HYPO|nr:ribose 5-phosphate isomerase B [Fusarium albosuccineum]
MSGLRIVIGGDDAGFDYKSILGKDLAADSRVTEVIDVGPSSKDDKTAYSSFAITAAEKVAAGEADRALLICGTGLVLPSLRTRSRASVPRQHTIASLLRDLF